MQANEKILQALKMARILCVVLALFGSVPVLSACDDNDGPAEELGEGIDDAADDIGDAVEDATDGK